MSTEKTFQTKFQELSMQAEILLSENKKIPEKELEKDPLKLIHELQTYQIELELQNEDLRRSQQELAESQASYAQFYDFAPVGYLTLSLKGFILKSNLTFADMLSIERKYLINQLLSAHIMAEDQNIYYRYLRSLLDSKTRQVCELRMTKRDGTPFDVQLESTIVSDESGDPEQFHTMIRDITEHKSSEVLLQKAHEDLEIRVNERTGELNQANKLLDALNAAQSMFISEIDPKILFDKVLQNILALTKSQYGFIGEVFLTNKTSLI